MQSTSLPPSNVIPANATQKRIARRLANYSYSIACACVWRNKSFNGFDDDATRAAARLNMRESALRAVFWRNLLVSEG